MVHAAKGTPDDDSNPARYTLEGARLTTTMASARHAKPVDGKPIELVVHNQGTKAALNPGDRVIFNETLMKSVRRKTINSD